MSSIQSVQFDPRTSAATESTGYWDNPALQEQVGDRAPTPLGSDAPAPIDSRRDTPTPLGTSIDGSDAGTKLADGATPDGKRIQRGELHSDDQVEITRERTLADAGFGRTYVSSDQLVLTTGAGDDQVGVTQRDDGTLDVDINGRSYEVRLGQGQELTLRTGAGNDTIKVAPNVKVNVVVDGGDGNDAITTGAGDDRVDGGAGDDTIRTGAGRDDVFGNTGADDIDAGEGDDVVYGGGGDDRLGGGEGTNFIEGGAGDDAIDGTQGRNMISAGRGDDAITSGSKLGNRIYNGDGADTVVDATIADRIYAQSADAVRFANGQRDDGQVVMNVEIASDAGLKGVKVEGSDAFRQRVEAELDFLRASPNGQQMLAAFDAASARGNTVTIQELANEQNGFAQTFSNDADIANGKAGRGGDVTISYNPSFHMAEFPAPVVVLYHEMSHAYNGVNGTFQPGTYFGSGPDSGNVPNAERQAVGLETSAPAFDFDKDPSTPATTANPDYLTENGMREELGLPDRPNYTL